MGLAWDASFTPDYVFSGLPTSGLIPSNAGQAGLLVSNSGRSLTQVTYTISAATAGQTFDPSRVFVGFMKDIDGTNCETPRNPECPGPTANLNAVACAGTLVSQSNGGFRVLAQYAAGFRVYLLNQSGINLTVAFKYKQA